MWGVPPLPRTLKAALRDAEHARRHVRLSALRDLVRHSRGDERPAALEKLVHVLEHDPEIDVRAEAALALADADGHEAFEPLLAAAEQGAPRLRQMAVLAVGELAERADARALAVLEAAWVAEEPAVRFQALVAIHHVTQEQSEKDERIDQLLYEAMSDRDHEVRAMAYRIGEERWAERPPPKHVVGMAEEALADSEPTVQLCAAILLASLRESRDARGTRGAPQLLQAAAGALRGASDADQQAAIELCARLELDGALPALERRAFGPLGLRQDSLAWHAHVALARLGHARARQSILRGLRAWSRDARTLAVVAAGRARLPEAKPLIAAMQDNPGRADPEAVAQALQELSFDAGGGPAAKAPSAAR